MLSFFASQNTCEGRLRPNSRQSKFQHRGSAPLKITAKRQMRFLTALCLLCYPTQVVSRLEYTQTPPAPVAMWNEREDGPMAKCKRCGRGPMFGNTRPWSKKATRRSWNINIQKVQVIQDGKPVSMRLCTSCIRTMEKA